QAAGHDDNVAAAQTTLQHLHHPAEVIADLADPEHVDAHLGELLRQMLRVGIHDHAEQHLGADGYDLAFHASPSGSFSSIMTPPVERGWTNAMRPLGPGRGSRSSSSVPRASSVRSS